MNEEVTPGHGRDCMCDECREAAGFGSSGMSAEPFSKQEIEAMIALGPSALRDRWLATVEDVEAERDALRRDLTEYQARTWKAEAANDALARRVETLTSVGAWLLHLKDGPRDADYEREKPQAWQALREALAADDEARAT